MAAERAPRLSVADLRQRRYAGCAAHQAGWVQDMPSDPESRMMDTAGVVRYVVVTAMIARPMSRPAVFSTVTSARIQLLSLTTVAD